MNKIARSLVLAGDRFLSKNGPRFFYKEATRLLERAQFHQSFSLEEMVSLSFQKTTEGIQNYKAFEFSDLPLTLARGKHCYLDLYVWRRRPTTIHNHHFSGAFQCLLGENVDLSFSFKSNDKIGKFHQLGVLTLDEIRNVSKGDIVPIAPGDNFIHQNHHHCDLAVNLCFRTIDIPKKNIANFLYSGLRYEKDGALLSRAERLIRLTKIADLNAKKLDLSIDDAIAFLMQTYGSTSSNPSFINLRNELTLYVKKKTKLNIDELIDLHESELDQRYSDYD